MASYNQASARQGRIYVAEFNRSVGDSIRTCASRLARRWGLAVDILPHRTTLRIERPPDMSWSTFQDALRSVIQPGRGAVLLFSMKSGNAYICSNVGNHPGEFQRIE
jgi:hypothetical protein